MSQSHRADFSVGKVETSIETNGVTLLLLTPIIAKDSKAQLESIANTTILEAGSKTSTSAQAAQYRG